MGLFFCLFSMRLHGAEIDEYDIEIPLKQCNSHLNPISNRTKLDQRRGYKKTGLCSTKKKKKKGKQTNVRLA
jgi:hypothetical protein